MEPITDDTIIENIEVNGVAISPCKFADLTSSIMAEIQRQKTNNKE